MNPNLIELLTRTDNVMNGRVIGWQSNLEMESSYREYPGTLHVGVDLGTAYTVIIVLNEYYQPIAGAYQFAQIVRDGLVVDFVGAVSLLRRMKQELESKIGFELKSASSSYPPGVAQAEVRATANVLQAAGMDCTGLIDEPSAANNVLQIKDGAIVDVGGGTTGIAVIKNGKVVYTADEPTGGTHFSLVIAGAKNLSFEQAEELKKDSKQQDQLLPVVRPVMEKVGSIIKRHVQGYNVKNLYLVGGSCAYPGMDKVVQEYTGITTSVPGSPLFVTPLGIAMHN
ncbi:MAG: ethanolamine utilization protein EutJ [Chloroflexi bacterium]|nr:ethanolamine utilization protein EutJ [Chloroflexota bacterium]